MSLPSHLAHCYLNMLIGGIAAGLAAYAVFLASAVPATSGYLFMFGFLGSLIGLALSMRRAGMPGLGCVSVIYYGAVLGALCLGLTAALSERIRPDLVFGVTFLSAIHALIYLSWRLRSDVPG